MSTNGAARIRRLIDADTHVNEPPDLWTSRLPAKFADRAPRMEHFDQGDAWILEGVDGPVNFGLNASAGIGARELQPWVRFDEIRRGGYDPKARLEELDLDEVDACILYPTPRISHAIFANKDPEFHLALVRAYNDWLSEYCAHAPDRLGGIYMLPNRGMDQVMAELERAAALPGMVGALLGCYPHGDLELKPEDDVLWRELATENIPLHIHVSLVNEMPSSETIRIPGDIRFYDAPKRILQFVWAGVFERFPELALALVEVDCGWVPYLKEHSDDRYRRFNFAETMGLPRPPSHYIEQNIYITYITDYYGIRNRHDIGVERLMWSSDFPHIPSDWPNSWRSIHGHFSGVPSTERELILAGNAERLYRFG